jgi:hypothetical protein
MPPIPSTIDFRTDSNSHIADCLEAIAKGLRDGHLAAFDGEIHLEITSPEGGNPWRANDIIIAFQGARIRTT